MTDISRDQKNKIRRQIVNIFDDGTERGAEKIVRVINFLDKDYVPSYWDTLSCMSSSIIFKKYAEQILAETHEAENNQRFINTIKQMNEYMLPIHDTCSNDGQSFRVTESSVQKAFEGLSNIWGFLPTQTKTKVVDSIKRIVVEVSKSKALVEIADKPLSKLPNVGPLAAIALSAVVLTYTAVKSIWDWYNGRISGKRCSKIIIDNFVATIASIGAGFGSGALIGMVAGPPVAIAGALIGGMAGGIAGNMVIDRLTQKFFNLPKDIALEHAYAFFGVECNATNNEVNAAYRRKCLQTHPDKPNGSQELFYEVQYRMQLIKVSRGQMF